VTSSTLGRATSWLLIAVAGVVLLVVPLLPRLLLARRPLPVLSFCPVVSCLCSCPTSALSRPLSSPASPSAVSAPTVERDERVPDVEIEVLRVD
jgi:hypothetical protein